MTGTPDTGASQKALLDYLRIYMIVWQKIDFIWGMFITAYIPLFGFLHFYPGQIGSGFAGLFVLAIGVFTWINATSLRAHYDIVVTMGHEFRQMNAVYGDLNGALERTAHDGKRRLVLLTHGFGFAGFLYLMGERVGAELCDGVWMCLGVG